MRYGLNRQAWYGGWTRRVLAGCLVGLVGVSFRWAEPAAADPVSTTGAVSQEEPLSEPILRIPVAHKHAFSWCYGYLTIGKRQVRLDIVQPSSDRDHGFVAPRAEVAADRWSVLGVPQPVIELTIKGKQYVLTWLANESEVQTGPAHRPSPPLAVAPYPALVALRTGSLPKASPPMATSTEERAPAGAETATTERLDGLYLGYKFDMSWSVGGPHVDPVLLYAFPSGMFMTVDLDRGAPGPDAQAELARANANSRGSYATVAEGRIQLRYQGGETTMLSVTPLCSCDGLKFSGSYQMANRAITFRPSGEFIDRGAIFSLLEARLPDQRARAPGPGTYQIARNRILLQYADGHRVVTAFAAPQRESAAPSWILLGPSRLDRAGN